MTPSKTELIYEAYGEAAFGRTLNEGAARAGVDLDWHWIRRSPEPASVEWESESAEARKAWAAVADLPGKPSAETCCLTFARAWPEIFGDNPRWNPKGRKADGWRAVAEIMAGDGDDAPGASG